MVSPPSGGNFPRWSHCSVFGHLRSSFWERQGMFVKNLDLAERKTVRCVTSDRIRSLSVVPAWPPTRAGCWRSSRCFSSISIPSDGKVTHAVVPGIVVGHRIDTGALIFAAKEADRLTNLAATCKILQDKDELRGRQSTKEDVIQALDSADALMIVSHPSHSLADAILHRASSAHVNSLHRAFLSVTSWCLDVLPYSRNGGIPERKVLDRALTVARRAYDLSLPFHLPLYQRLMQCVAEHYDDSVSDNHETMHAVGETILEISSWVKASLDAPVDSSLFAPSLVTLLRRHRLRYAVVLLLGMRENHCIDILDPETTIELMVLVQECLGRILSDNATGFSEQGLDASALVDLLEPSVRHAAEHEYVSMRNLIKDILRVISSEDLEDLLRKFPAPESEEDYDSDEEVGEVDPLDRVADAMLSNTTETQGLLSGAMVQNSRRPKLGHGVYSEESEWGDPYGDFEDFLYGGNQYQFPDIKPQIEKLNGGRTLRFNKEYEEILWNRDYREEEDDLVEQLLRLEAESDSDDDDDDEDD